MKVKSTLILSLAAMLTLCCFTGCSKYVVVKPVQSASASTAPSSDNVAYPVALSTSELEDFEKALNDDSNYGFLLSAYADVRDADLNQIFYVGAGLPSPSNAENIKNADTKVDEDIKNDIDSTVLTAQQISDFLSKKTGYTLADMSSSLSWTYIADYDAYIHWHGDTNKITVTCTSGSQISDNAYEIEYTAPNGIFAADENSYSSGTVTVKLTDGTFQFISNSLR